VVVRLVGDFGDDGILECETVTNFNYR
jgi:hypothetical protein